jgi:hypothetical protein
MYIEYTSQGFNIIGLSQELLSEIIRALRFSWSEKKPDVQELIDKVEEELKNNL